MYATHVQYPFNILIAYNSTPIHMIKSVQAKYQTYSDSI